jgi:xylulokinase
MSTSPYILAHDLGTTGDKATLFDADGHAVASTFEAYDTAYPRPCWAEQDPADWQRALLQCTRRLLAQASIPAGEIAVVSFSGHMQGALMVDREGVPLRSSIIWADQRATSQAEWIGKICGKEALYRLTGQRASPAYTSAKVLWIRDNQPDLYRRAYKVVQAKDYAAFTLTGVWATDYSDAAGTQLFDLRGRRWAEDLMGALGLDTALFPEAYPSTTVIGRVTAEAAAATGLLAGTPVVIGGGDGACATVGAGSIREGDAYHYIGSSSWIALTTGRPILDPQQRTFTFVHLDPALYFSVGTMQAGGGSYDWLERLWRDEGQVALYQAMDAQAATVPAGAGGILFLPHLLGERSPYWNPLARGAFVGLAMSHGRPELTRAVLEGVALTMRLILDVLQSHGVQIEAMRLIGGGAKSALWRQILADTYDLPILLPTLAAEATSLGAAVAGGVGVGIFAGFDVTHCLVPVREAERPDPARHRRYMVLYDLFRQTYAALEPIFEQLSMLDADVSL